MNARPPQVVDTTLIIFGYGLLAISSLLALRNFYCAFLRFPVHRALGKSREIYRWDSGFPIFASIGLWISSAVLLWKGHSLLGIAGLLISLLDTGGPIFLAYHVWKYEMRSSAKKPTTYDTSKSI